MNVKSFFDGCAKQASNLTEYFASGTARQGGGAVNRLNNLAPWTPITSGRAQALGLKGADKVDDLKNFIQGANDRYAKQRNTFGTQVAEKGVARNTMTAEQRADRRARAKALLEERKMFNKQMVEANSMAEGIDGQPLTLGQRIHASLLNDKGEWSGKRLGIAGAGLYMGANVIGHGSLGIPFISSASWNR